MVELDDADGHEARKVGQEARPELQQSWQQSAGSAYAFGVGNVTL